MKFSPERNQKKKKKVLQKNTQIFTENHKRIHKQTFCVSDIED